MRGVIKCAQSYDQSEYCKTGNCRMQEIFALFAELRKFSVAKNYYTLR